MITYFAAFLFLTSCTSIEKLVETGHYEEAFELAVNKIAGKKNKKTDNVKGLEKAFVLLQDEDLNKAKILIGENNSSNWSDLHNLYTNIDYRQSLIEPLLPLVSKDGYKANFTFVKIDELLSEAALNAAEYDYNLAMNNMENARRGDKEAAKLAYYTFEGVHSYMLNYKDVNILQEEAYNLGQTRILIDLSNRTHTFIPREVERRMLNINTSGLNEKWTKYYVGNNGNEYMDYRATMVLTDLDVSPEREIRNIYVNEKRIEDGLKPMKGKDGKVKKDSLGNVIKVASFKKVRARVTEIRRTKRASLSGFIVLKDVYTGEKISSERMCSVVNFEDISCRFVGDKRALESKWKPLLRDRLTPFPTDIGIALNAAHDLKLKFKNRLKRMI